MINFHARLLEIGTKVRDLAETWAKEKDYDYETLTLQCAVVSSGLLVALAYHQIEAILVWGFAYDEAHFWVEVQANPPHRLILVMDLTATQFDPNAPRVVIGTYRELRGSGYFVEERGSDAMPAIHEVDSVEAAEFTVRVLRELENPDAAFTRALDLLKDEGLDPGEVIAGAAKTLTVWEYGTAEDRAAVPWPHLESESADQQVPALE